MDEELRSKIVNQEPLNQAYASSDFAQGIERGKFMERERIIKLLEGLIDNRTTWEMSMEYWVQKKLLEYVITLLKEENK